MVEMLARVGTVEAGDEQNGSPDMQFVLSRTIRGVICLPCVKGSEKEGTLGLETAFGRGTAIVRGAGVGVNCTDGAGLLTTVDESGQDQSDISLSSESYINPGGDEGNDGDSGSSTSGSVLRNRALGTDRRHFVELTLGFGLCSICRRRNCSNSSDEQLWHNAAPGGHGHRGRTWLGSAKRACSSSLASRKDSEPWTGSSRLPH